MSVSYNKAKMILRKVLLYKNNNGQILENFYYKINNVQIIFKQTIWQNKIYFYKTDCYQTIVFSLVIFCTILGSKITKTQKK